MLLGTLPNSKLITHKSFVSQCLLWAGLSTYCSVAKPTNLSLKSALLFFMRKLSNSRRAVRQRWPRAAASSRQNKPNSQVSLVKRWLVLDSKIFISTLFFSLSLPRKSDQLRRFRHDRFKPFCANASQFLKKTKTFCHLLFPSSSFWRLVTRRFVQQNIRKMLILLHNKCKVQFV